jgi:cell division protein FtsL
MKAQDISHLVDTVLICVFCVLVTAIILTFFTGCVSTGYHNRKLVECAARTNNCQERLEEEMRRTDDKKYLERQKNEPQFKIDWE